MCISPAAMPAAYDEAVLFTLELLRRAFERLNLAALHPADSEILAAALLADASKHDIARLAAGRSEALHAMADRCLLSACEAWVCAVAHEAATEFGAHADLPRLKASAREALERLHADPANHGAWPPPEMIAQAVAMEHYARGLA